MTSGKKFFLVAMALCLIMGLVSCKETPKENIIKGKNAGVMESKITEKIEENKNNQIPTVWQEKVIDNVNSNEVIIDATVEAAGNQEFPIVKIKKNEISVEWASDIMRKLSKGNKIYTYTDETVLTKDQISGLIVSKKQVISEMKSDTNNFDLSESEKNIVIQDIENEIAQMQSDYIDAPIELEENIMPLDFVESSDGGASSMRGTVDLGKTNKAEIVIDKTDIGGNIYYANWDDECIYPQSLSSNTDNLNNITITLNEATKLGQEFLNNLGIQDFSPSLILSGDIYSDLGEIDNKQCYVVYYTRTFEGVETSYKDSSMDWLISMNKPISESDKQYAPNFKQESIQLCITDSGVNYMNWEMPVDQIEVINNNVSILSFEEIIDSFKKQVKNEGVWKFDDTEAIKSSVNINKITIGMTQVREKDTYDSLLMIPAWNFYGTETLTYNDGEESGGYILNENNEYINEIPGYSYLTINAIDGSIINPILGY